MAERKPEEHLQNADLNLNQYGDDSTPANQISTPWGMNQKYTWENTLNSNIPYNANIRTADLDPEYKYWWDAQLANSAEAWYIARRNDNIASALYNEGKRSKEDVVSFLGSQKNWNNSTEADRFNTVESVWKRIWDIAEQNDKDKTQLEVKEMEKENKAEPKGKNVDVNTFLQWSTTELFGKMITWADTAPYDHNSLEWKQAEARLKQYQNINALSVPQLASSIKAWSILSWWQAMRDLQTFNPEKYQQLQDYQKKEDTMAQINMIASGNFTDSEKSLQDKTWESINNYLNETVANAGWSALARMDLDTALSQNQWIVNYAERMSYYQAQINQLDQTIWNLAEDARSRLSKTTGENVPEYMIQNYINNRSKKLYKQRDNLMNQYNYYKWIYEAQIEEESQKWERDFKERQLQLQEQNALWNQKMDQANMNYKYDQLNYNYDKLYGDNWTGTGNMRTERNNNPTAMTTDVAKSLGLVEWVDYVKWDPFVSWSGTLYTAKLLWDPIETTIKAFDKAVSKWINAFYTQWGKQRWTHTAMSNDQWKKLSNEEKRNVVLSMLQREWGDINKMAYYNSKGVSNSKSDSNSKDNKTYTNEELYTQLRGWKIKYADFLKKWNGDEPQEEVDDWVAKTYFTKSPMMHLSDMKSSVSQLSNMIWDDVLAEMYTLEHLNNNKNISSDKVAKIVNDYVVETNKWLKDADKINTSEYLALALRWRYTTEKELKNVLKAQWVDNYKKVAKEIMNIWNE